MATALQTLKASLQALFESSPDSRAAAADGMGDAIAAYVTGAAAPSVASFRSTSVDCTIRANEAIVEATAGAAVVTLPAPGTAGECHTVRNATGGALTIATVSGTIDGSATYGLVDGETLAVVANGTLWRVV